MHAIAEGPEKKSETDSHIFKLPEIPKLAKKLNSDISDRDCSRLLLISQSGSSDTGTGSKDEFESKLVSHFHLLVHFLYAQIN